MMFRYLGIALLAGTIAACGDHGHDHGDGGHDHGHHHEGKHGGQIVELGNHEGFAEVIVDHDEGIVKLWIYMGEDMKDTDLDVAPTLNFKSKEGPKQLKATGKGHHWVFQDQSLKRDPTDARFVLAIGGKTYNPKWDHDHHGHDHDH